VALRCPGELTKDLILKAKAKDSKFVLEDISKPRRTTLEITGIEGAVDTLCQL